MAEIMNGYELMAPFSNKNAGFSRWTLANKDNREYFLKEFINPVYPSDMFLSEQIKQQRIEECKEFEKRQSIGKTDSAIGLLSWQCFMAWHEVQPCRNSGSEA